MNTISEQVIKIIAEQTGRDDIKPEQSFREDLMCDSLDEVEIVMQIEEELEVLIEDEQAEQIKTVQQAIDYVEAKLSKIELKPVKSSQMDAIGHAGRTLAVRFRGDSIYCYPGVTEDEYAALMNAPSIGSHFIKHFKQRPLYFKVQA